MTETYQCPRCVARGKTWAGGDPRCAFLKDGTYTLDNWMCATMLELRELCREKRDDEGGFWWRGEWDESIGVLAVEELDDERLLFPYLVMGWYKERGRTGVALLIQDDEHRALTLRDADLILKQHSR